MSEGILALALALGGEAAAKDGVERIAYEPGEGIVFNAEKSEATAKMSLWVQPVAGVAVDEDGGTGILELRRARVDFVVKPKKWLKVEFGLAGDRGNVRVRDALVEIELHKAFVLKAGRTKAPSGLERETSSRHNALVERSSIAEMVPGRTELVGIDGEAGPLFWRTAVARVDVDELPLDAPLAIDGAARVGLAWEKLGLSGRILLSPRPMSALGIRLDDPSDGTGLGDARPWAGTGIGAGADVAGRAGPARLVAEGAMLREGRQVGTVSGHSLHFAGYGLIGVGFGPELKREDYDDSFAATKGFEVVVRADAQASWPAPGSGPKATGYGASVAASWSPLRSLKVQVEGRGGVAQIGEDPMKSGVTALVWLAVGP